jgi:hypothetical protein
MIGYDFISVYSRMTPRLNTAPELYRLAQQLGLGSRGDPLVRIQQYVDEQVDNCLSTVPINSCTSLLKLVSAAFSVQLEIISGDSDIQTLANRYGHLGTSIRQQLEMEFLRGDTLGYLVANPMPLPGDRLYVAFVDARGVRHARAYFTAWHEVTHIILSPPQLSFAGFRRTRESFEKDPLESLVDVIAGSLAFHRPFFEPIVRKELDRTGEFSLDLLKGVRDEAVPEASLQATAIALAKNAHLPISFIVAAEGLKARDRLRSSGQLEMSSNWGSSPQPVLRAITVVASPAARELGWRVFQNMRIPIPSVIHDAHGSPGMLYRARENQGLWEASGKGFLPALPYVVEAHGYTDSVYATITVEG